MYDNYEQFYNDLLVPEGWYDTLRQHEPQVGTLAHWWFWYGYSKYRRYP